MQVELCAFLVDLDNLHTAMTQHDTTDSKSARLCVYVESAIRHALVLCVYVCAPALRGEVPPFPPLLAQALHLWWHLILHQLLLLMVLESLPLQRQEQVLPQWCYSQCFLHRHLWTLVAHDYGLATHLLLLQRHLLT